MNLKFVFYVLCILAALVISVNLGTELHCYATVTPDFLEGWNKTFGTSESDWGDAMIETSDGSYVLVGNTNSYGAGGYDLWLIKTDADGNELWNKTFGGPGLEAGNSVIETTDGGYVLAGIMDSYGSGGMDVWLIKTDVDGNELWDKTFGGSGDDFEYSVIETQDGGYVVAGFTESYGAGGKDVWLIKTDVDGNEVWNKTYGGSDDDWGDSVVETQDGSYVIEAFTKSYGAGGWDVWLLKTDADGNEVWEKTFGGSGSDAGDSIIETTDGGYIIAGITDSYGAGGYDAWLLKTDADGNEVWKETFGDSGDDRGYSAIETGDGGYLMVGYTDSYDAAWRDMWLIKTDADGNELWKETFGDSGDDRGYSVIETVDGSYTIAGNTQSYGAGDWDIWLIKIEAEAPTIPSVISVNPATGDQGETLDVTITGTYFSGTEVSFGEGITTNSFTVDSETQITANITIDDDAIVGTRDVSVTTAGGTGTLIDAFTVEQKESNGELGGCSCNSASTPVSAKELAIGWGIIGLCWGGGYYLVRRSGKRKI